MKWIRAFVAGYAATLVFHQGTLWLLSLLGLMNVAIYKTDPVGPLQIPAIMSLSFWAGIWGILLVLFLQKTKDRFPVYPAAIVFGALGPSLVALAIVFPLKGGEFMAGWNPKILLGALIINGAWGFGTKYLVGRN